MLTAKQTKAVALLFDGKTKKEIAEELNVTEKTIYNWRQLDEFKNELQKVVNNYLIEIRANLIKNQENLALNAKSEMVKFSATKDLLDRTDVIQNDLSNSRVLEQQLRKLKAEADIAEMKVDMMQAATDKTTEEKLDELLGKISEATDDK